MSNVIAGVVRGQFPHLEEHIAKKKEIYERYKKGFEGLPVTMNPFDEENSVPNYWLSCMLIDENAMCKQVRGENEVVYIKEKGKTCPTEILETMMKYNAEGRPIWKPMHMQPIYRMNGFVTREGNGRGKTNACPTEILETMMKYNAEGRPIWKPMHMQPIYRMNGFVTREGNGRGKTNAYIQGGALGKDGRPLDVGMDIFQRGLCLPSDNKMTEEEQNIVIEIIRSCFE